MNKIVLNIGLLVFFLAILFFSQRGMLIEDVLIRAFSIFIVVTIMSGIFVLVFVKSINKTTLEKGNENKEDNIGIKNDE